MLLMPQYVARKSFFLEWLNHRRAKSGSCRPVFLGRLVTSKKHHYSHPLKIHLTFGHDIVFSSPTPGPTKQPYVFAAPANRQDVKSMRQQQLEGEVEAEEALIKLGEIEAIDQNSVVGGTRQQKGTFQVAAGSFQV